MKKLLNHLVRHPTHASRSIGSALTIAALVGFTFDVGMTTGGGEQLQSRLLGSVADVQVAFEEEVANGTVDDVAEGLCRQYVVEEPGVAANTFLSEFENRFDGVLPGAGILTIENPATTEARREQIIFDAMAGYAERKFCVSSDRFSVMFSTNYEKGMSALQDYYSGISVREELTPLLSEAGDRQWTTFFGVMGSENSIIQSDLRDTEVYITSIVDSAIESAVNLDRTTHERIAFLAQRSGNTLAQVRNDLLEQNNAFLDRMSNMQAFANGPRQREGGIGGIREFDFAYDEARFNTSLTANKTNEYSDTVTNTINTAAKSQASITVSQGLQALVRGLNDARLAQERILYAHAVGLRDPFVITREAPAANESVTEETSQGPPQPMADLGDDAPVSTQNQTPQPPTRPFISS